MNASVNRRWRLSAMMAMIYAVQGAFWPLLAIHLTDLGIGGRDRGWVFATLAIASMAVPLGAGRLVDRFLATQHALALIYAAGTGILIAVAGGWVRSAGGLFVVFLMYWGITAPAYGLANALAMRNLTDPGREFGAVRSWGTVGWMAVGWVVSLVMAASGSTRSGQGAFEAFWVAAAFSAAVSLYVLTLPHTPPLDVGPRAGDEPGAVAEIVARPGVAIVLFASFGVYLTMPVVYQVIPNYFERSGLPRAWVTAAMTLGQTTEIALLFALPRLIRRVGMKVTMALGIAAWFIRFGTLAMVPPLWLAVAGMLFHGVGIACFTVGAQMFLDARAPGQRRASAQALFLVATSGAGAFLGSLLTGEVVSRSDTNDVLVFLFPCIILGALLLYFLRGFRDSASGVPWAGAPSDEYRPRSPSGRAAAARVGQLVTESADG